MLKALSRLWLRGLARAGKAQQKHAKKVFKNLLSAPKIVTKTKIKTLSQIAKGAGFGRVITPPATVRARAGKSSSKAETGWAALPGKWLASYYSASLPDGGLVSARRMAYYLYLPAQFPKRKDAETTGEGWPLIVMLHGCRQTAPEFSQGTRMNQIADKKGIAVLYPQQSLRANAHRCWEWYDKATQNGGGDVRLIVGMIEKVMEKYPIDKTRIYLCGMSAGAAMAHIVALTRPDLIAAIGLHSGPMFGAGHSTMGAYSVMQHGASKRVGPAIAEVRQQHPVSPTMPTILIHGKIDTIVRPINQSQLVQQCLLLNHLTAENMRPAVVKPGVRTGRNPCKAVEVRDAYRGRTLLLRTINIAQLEHAWSGGDERLAFNSAAGPDASKMMVNFFARHRRFNTLRPLLLTPILQAKDLA